MNKTKLISIIAILVIVIGVILFLILYSSNDDSIVTFTLHDLCPSLTTSTLTVNSCSQQLSCDNESVILNGYIPNKIHINIRNHKFQMWKSNNDRFSMRVEINIINDDNQIYSQLANASDQNKMIQVIGNIAVVQTPNGGPCGASMIIKADSSNIKILN